MGLFDQGEPPSTESKPMRDHQEEFFQDCRQAVRRGATRILGCASVGWGKTRVAAEMFKGSYAKVKFSMFTTPRNALIEPSVEEFEEQGLVDIGIIQQNHPRTNPDAKLQVASIHTAVHREIPNLSLVIVDEAHLSTKDFNALLDSEEWKSIIVIALSATPYSKGLGLRWPILIQTKRTSQLIDEGYLVRPRYLVGSVEPNTAGKKKHLDENGNRVLSEKDEAAAMGDKRIIGDVVETYLKHGEGRSGFYYAVNLAHARSLRDEFEQAGVPCGYIDGSMSRNERMKLLRLYREAHYRIVVNYGVLTTGIDEDVRIIGICRIILNETDWVQIIGRGLRTDNPRKRVAGTEPKRDCLVIDHGGNLTRDDGTALAPAEDIYHDHLDMHDPNDKTKQAFEGELKPETHRKCKKCGGLIPPRTKSCPSCGEEKASTDHGVVAVKAEFREYGGSKPEKVKQPKKAPKDEKQMFYSSLLAMANERGYKPGWVAQNYRAKFDVWPKGLLEIPANPSPAVRKFIHDKRIAYLNAQKAPKAEVTA